MIARSSISTRSLLVRSLSSAVGPKNSTIDSSRTVVQLTESPSPKLAKEKLVFGKSFSDHMLEVDWDSVNGWKNPVISPYHNLSISPAASSLHYGLQCFEGMKAYKDDQGKIRMFRPDCNMDRLNDSMKRLFMPGFNGEGLLECIKQLLRIDESWIPEGDGYSIYLRPTAISTYPFLGVGAPLECKIFVIMSPVGPYYAEGFKPIKLYADTENVRAWPGGVGNTKVGGNYAPCIAPQMAAAKKGCSQVLWLFGEDHEITEVGAMNIFFFLINEQGEKELITAPLTRGDILPGVTRRSMLELARNWGEFKVSERYLQMGELLKASKEGRLIEAFGAGTAAVVAPVKGIHYKGEDIMFPTGEKAGALTQRMWDNIISIQYGRTHHPWSVVV